VFGVGAFANTPTPQTPNPQSPIPIIIEKYLIIIKKSFE
jgi:hypothetical protein